MLFDVFLLSYFLGKPLCGGVVGFHQSDVPKPNRCLAVTGHEIDVAGVFYDIALQVLVVHEFVLVALGTDHTVNVDARAVIVAFLEQDPGKCGWRVLSLRCDSSFPLPGPDVRCARTDNRHNC